MVIYSDEGDGIRQSRHQEDVLRRTPAWFENYDRKSPPAAGMSLGLVRSGVGLPASSAGFWGHPQILHDFAADAHRLKVHQIVCAI